MHFAQIAKELREDTGLSQQKLADKLGLSSSGIARWELGQSEPGSQALMIYAKYFGVSTDYLLGLEDDFGVKKIAPATNTGNEGKLNEKEKALLEAFGKLLPETQDFILRSIQSFIKTDSAKKTIK